MEVYLACKVFEDGDGVEQVEPLGIFYDEKAAVNFCISTHVKEMREFLFNEDGTKKRLKISDGIWDGVHKSHYVNYPEIYYQKLEMAENRPEEFRKEMPYSVDKYEVKYG